MPSLRLIDESFTLRRLARRFGWRPRALRAEVAERPVGVKLELTHACNLRCGFCYTDSPRHTLQRTPDLPDDAWLAIADRAADLGVIEVVLSGGEPFLRRELVFELLDRLARREVGLTLNTNGWFVDDGVADRLARTPDLRVDISIDGATAALHDASRGVPGSWRRAVTATSRLLERGVAVVVVHVVTPDNEHAFPAFLEQMWTLGVTSVRATPVVEIGAAARGERWAVSRQRLRRAIAQFDRSHDDGMRVALQRGNAGILAIRDEAAPASMLVRPNGTVVMDSLHPFGFGHAVDDGLDQCWRQIAAGWRSPDISSWAGSLGSSHDLPRSGLIPYLDVEVPVGEAQADAMTGAERRAGRSSPVPARARPKDDTGDASRNLDRARETVRDLALARRYRLGAVRVGGGGPYQYVRAARSGTVARLNPTASFLVGALDDGTPAEAIEQLAERFGETDRARIERDVLATGRSLLARGILVPATQATHP